MQFTEIWFLQSSGFSGQPYFRGTIPFLYITFWTSWPCLIINTLEKDINNTRSLKAAYLYRAGQCNYFYSLYKLGTAALNALIHSVICYWIPILSLGSPVTNSGADSSLNLASLTSCCLIVHIVLLKLLLESVSITWIHIGVVIGGFTVFYCTLLVMSWNLLAL